MTAGAPVVDGPSERPSTGEPTFAVVIPCWNAQPWIARAIQSVLDQDGGPVHVIVIDDGSTDGSLDIIKAFGDRITWESGPNQGGCAARNRGLALANTDWVLFLDADDYCEPQFIDAICGHADGTTLDVLVGASRLQGRDGSSTVHSYAAGTESDELLKGWLYGRYVQTGAIMWRTAYLRSIGGWNESVRRSQDIELVLRALLKGARALAVDAGHCVWIDHASPHRVGSQTGYPQIESEIAFHDALIGPLEAVRPDLRLSMAIRYYSLAAQAFGAGYDDLGHRALATSRRLGLRGHTGSWRSRLGSTALGLQTYFAVRRALTQVLTLGHDD